jgi:two-component sensor histidine kinase
VTEATGFRKFETFPANGLIPQKLDELLLLREMHHRLANTFSVLISALRCDFELSTPPKLQGALARFERRIIAFGSLHRSLLVGTRSDWVGAQYYVEHLCKALSDALLEPLGIKCEVQVDDGKLPSQRCELLGLVIAELVTNAAKHAFCGRDNGVVRVELIKKVDAWLCIVSDNGEGTGTAISGIGSKIVEQLVRTMGGHFVTRSGLGGTSITITFPVTGPGRRRCGPPRTRLAKSGACPR